MFRFRKSVPLSYDQQAYIYYYSRLYKQHRENDQAFIRKLCRKAGGPHWKAVLALVSGKMTIHAACSYYYISPSTLDRAVRQYYREFGVAWEKL